MGIEAPRQIRIDRAEVLERIRKENIEAGKTDTEHHAWAAHAAQRANERSAPRERSAISNPAR